MRSLYLPLLFISSLAAAQVTDSFTDGDFTANPAWSGDAAEFTINTAKQLQLNNTIAGASYLSTPSPTSSLNNVEWRFYVKQSFAPSSLNYGRVYLASDQANLEGSLNGYYLQFGESGSNDAVELFCQTGLASVSVARGTNAQIANSFTIGIKVTRDAAGLWKLYVDAAGGTAYAFEVSGTNNTHTTTNFFGVTTVYSLSNANKFYFDDFYNGPVIVDSTPPIIVSSIATSSTKVAVLFSEAVDLTTSQTLTNYSANNSLGAPSNALRDTINSSRVYLTFATTFTLGLTNILTITNITDLSGNPIAASTTNFTYYIPKPFDVVINEIMADPDPVVGLPNYEYAELYNRKAFPISLKNWSLVVGTTIKVIPDITISANSYVLLTSAAGKSNFDTTIINVVGFSSFSLTNAGQTLTLKTQQGAIISTVSYTDNWYQDPNKQNGGWSIEQADPNNPCAGMENWRASTNSLGGTPGHINSINASNSDNAAPQVVRAVVVATDTLQLYFNEPLDSTTMLTPAIYTINNGIGTPTQVKPVAPDFMSVRLTLSTSIQVGILYTITVTNVITDCVGNPIGPVNSAQFALPEPAMPNDIVINEILADPNTGGVDFVEIYNRSNKVIDLKTMTISQFDTINNVPTGLKLITSNGYLMFPKQYLVLSTDGAAVKSQYNTTNPQGFVDVPSMISMNISGGTICLSTNANIIDVLKYYDKMQFPLLSVTKGVSLERIDFNRPTQDLTNWHSAAQDVGFATPAYKNSQYNDAGETDNAIEITPEVFSPDEDGFNDIVSINYHFDTPGFIANITIYDSKGRVVKPLVRNELLGIKGTFSWDGINADREKSRLGIYIIFTEVFDLTGKVKQYKKTCVLGGKL